MATARNLMVDWDCFDHRSRHSTGWKEHRFRYQWEHRVLEQEKHQKNRDRKVSKVQKNTYSFEESFSV